MGLIQWILIFTVLSFIVTNIKSSDAPAIKKCTADKLCKAIPEGKDDCEPATDVEPSTPEDIKANSEESLPKLHIHCASRKCKVNDKKWAVCDGSDGGTLCEDGKLCDAGNKCPEKTTEFIGGGTVGSPELNAECVTGKCGVEEGKPVCGAAGAGGPGDGKAVIDPKPGGGEAGSGDATTKAAKSGGILNSSFVMMILISASTTFFYSN